MADLVFLQFLIVIAYLAAAVGFWLVARAVGLDLPLDRASLLVIVLPLPCLMLAEALTGLWMRIPGGLGLGGLTIVGPAFCAGLVAGLAALAGHAAFGPIDTAMPRASGALTPWLILCLSTIAVGLTLWRYWPAPQARLF